MINYKQIYPNYLKERKRELVNEGMYGKALCKYLKESLPVIGIEVPFYNLRSVMA